MYYTFNPIRHCDNANDYRTIEISDGPFLKIDHMVYNNYSRDFICNRGGACSITAI